MTTEYDLKDKALIASDDCIRKRVIIAAGHNLPAGTILGRITVGRKFQRSLIGDADDGSRTPICVLLEDAAAADVDVEATIGLAGSYVKDNMTGLTEAAEDTLEARAIYFV